MKLVNTIFVVKDIFSILDQFYYVKNDYANG